MLPDWISPGNFVITQEVITLFENKREILVKIVDYLSKLETKPLFITIDSLKMIKDKNLRDLINPIISTHNSKFVQKSLCNQKRNNCTVGIIQMNFENENKFPFKLKDEKEITKKIEKILNYLEPYNIDILCFPELIPSKKIIDEIFLKQDKKIPIIIGGSFYNGNFNSCPIIIDYLGRNEIVIQEKINLSKWEDSCFPQKAMCKGRTINIPILAIYLCYFV